jgi:pyruvate/2-oxoglutarate dehydrogenase complex dihydrolipoamide dehydrogenase (E3) component
LAMELAKKNWNIAIVERHKVGGSCINYGCTPSKTMMASAYTANIVRCAGEFGIEAELKKIHLPAVLKRKNEIVDQFRKGIENSFEEEENIQLFYGEAFFSAPYRITVSLREGESIELQSEKIFINCGGQPSIPEIKGISEIDYLDSTSIMELEEIPRHLMVIGGNYLGLEFAQMFKRFGSKVSVLEQNDQLLKKEDKDIADEMQKILEEEGLEILLNTQIHKLNKTDQNEIEINYSLNNKESILRGSHILFATGRKPNSTALKLQNAGIKTDEKGYIKVNEKLETNITGVFALGDIKGGPAFTHISYDDFRIIKSNLFSEGSTRKITDRMYPYTMFTDPELGRVGLTQKDALEKGYKIKVAKMPLSKAARAIERGKTNGLMKVIIDEDSEKILGASILSMAGGEILAIIQVAMMGNLSYTNIRDGVFSHPTLAESLNNLFMSVE